MVAFEQVDNQENSAFPDRTLSPKENSKLVFKRKLKNKGVTFKLLEDDNFQKGCKLYFAVFRWTLMFF